ncbi:hypothetical protein BB560_005942, partial [Smittium megazygosporum]
MEYSFTSPFILGDYQEGAEPLTTVELSILRVLEEIKNKKHWNLKIKDPKISGKWKAELSGHFEKEIIDYAFDELEYYADAFTENIVPGPVDKVYVADDYIPIETLEDFKAQVSKLENVDESLKDYHPGSNNQVLDLVHPSLYPLIYGLSRAISTDVSPQEVPNWRESIGKGEIAEAPYDKEKVANEFLSRSSNDLSIYKSFKYQWLPSEFQVTEGKVRILSYINNLHPELFSKLYRSIESIFGLFVPLFSQCLTDSCIENTHEKRVDESSYYNESYEEFVERILKAEGGWKGDPYDFSEAMEDDLYERYNDEIKVIPPKEIVFSEDRIKRKIKIDFSNSRLQIIVKLANIVLSPENPKYNGGVWHVEGMENENIVATGIYYYSNENVTESCL